MKNNYPPLIILKKTRTDYLEVLRKADKSDPSKAASEHYSTLVQFVADEMISGYWNIFL